jgi:tripartite-type tricarboxylate transporter receptor subunit TctC
MSAVIDLSHAACAAIVLALAPVVFAQAPDGSRTYPTRPVRIVVPFAAGSGPDFRARELGPKLAAAWGQPIVVENRPGAGGQLAMEQVAHATADGYTLVMAGQSPLAIAPHLTQLRYDPLKDFAPVTRMSKGPILLLVRPQLPVRNLRELVEHANRHPGKLNAATWGTGTITHLALELFMRTAGVRIVHVPYKSAGQGINDLMGGNIDAAFEFYPAIGPQLRAGRLHAIAVSGRERLRALPEVPTFTEAGVRDMEAVSGWQGLAAPAGTARPLVLKIRTTVARVLALPEIQTSYAESGFDTVGDTPEQFAAFIRAEYARWGKLIAEAGIRAE